MIDSGRKHGMSVATPLDENPAEQNRRARVRRHRLAVAAYLVLLALVAVLIAFPVRSELIRTALICGVFAAWAGALFLFWNQIVIRLICVVPALVAAGILFLPNRTIDSDGLRAAYVSCLQAYDGTPYIWGGETRLGIDCSGLIRAGLIDAEFKEGMRTFNFTLLRKSASLWWNDCSAKALGEEYQGRTRTLFTAPSVNETDDSRLQPGDLAVVDGGLHIMAYVGDHTWIEADPGDESRVVRVAAPSKRGWFVTEAKFMRWRILEPTPRNAEPR